MCGINAISQILGNAGLSACAALMFSGSGTFAQPEPVVLTLKGSVSLRGSATDIQLVGTCAYLTWAGGLEIFSVTNPSSPVRLGGYATPEQANAVHVAGHYAYLALGTPQTVTNDAGAFEIVDVSDPANPVRMSRAATRSRANGISVTSDYACIAESSRWTGSNHLGAMEIFDVRTISNSTHLATIETVGSATSVDVVGGYAYLADGVTDLQVFDMANPAAPLRVGAYHSDIAVNGCGFEPGGPANYVRVLGNLAYSAGDNGLHILDISDPTRPTSIGDNFCFPIHALRVSGQHVYAAVYSSVRNSFFLQIEDAVDPANLVRVGLKDFWPSTVFHIANGWVYVAANHLLIYHISNRPSITSVSFMEKSVGLTWDYAPGFLLQHATSLTDPQWNTLPDSGVWTEIELPSATRAQFFRLVRP